MLQKIIARNNITIHGTGSKSMFLVHGYGCDQNMWRFITPQFKDDYKIILIDLVGSGKSDENSYDYEKYVYTHWEKTGLLAKLEHKKKVT